MSIFPKYANIGAVLPPTVRHGVFWITFVEGNALTNEHRTGRRGTGVRGTVTARDTFRSSAAGGCGVKLAGTDGAFFETATDVLCVPVFLTFNASGRDAKVFADVDQVIFDTDAAG
jgi:hypothetical protein